MSQINHQTEGQRNDNHILNSADRNVLPLPERNQNRPQNKAELQEYMRRRFVRMPSRGADKRFYDLFEDIGDLQVMHLCGIAAEFGLYDSKVPEMIGCLHFSSVLPGSVYRPHARKLIQRNGHYCLNAWRPSQVKPKKGDAKPFTDHLLMALGSQEKVDFLLDLLSWSYQYKADQRKPHIACYFYHQEGGQGKTIFASTLREVFGGSAVQTINTVSKLDSTSAVELWKKSLLIIDDAQITKSSRVYDGLKAHIGSDFVDADVKHKGFSRHEIPAILFMLSNRPPQFLEPHDRRFFVSEWHLGLAKEDAQEFFRGYSSWLVSGGYEAIAHLLATRPLDVDRLFEGAPETEEKRLAIGMSESPVVERITEFLEENENAKLFTLDAFEGIWKDLHVKATERKHKLREAGLRFRGRTKINGKQPNVWLAPGVEITKKGGLLVEHEGEIYKPGDVLMQSPHDVTKISIRAAVNDIQPHSTGTEDDDLF